MLRVLIFILAFVSSISYAKTLTSVEMSIRQYIIQQKKNQVELLEQLVNMNSGTSNTHGVYEVGKIIQAELDALGFKTHWEEEPTSMHKAGTLIAEKNGTYGKRLLLIGHLDTVFAEHGKFQSYTAKKNSAKGPGVLDDKGGVVVMLYALKALQAANVLQDASITLVLTGDEEESGKPTRISRKPLIEIAKNADIALDFEPTITLETATVGRRGISAWLIEVHGNESHSATIFQKDVGVGAIFELSRILQTMRSNLVSDKTVTFNPGIVMGGTTVDYEANLAQATVFGKKNVVAKIAYANGDFRYLTKKQKQRFEARLQAIVKRHLPGTTSTVVFQDGIPAMQPTKDNVMLLKQYSKVSQDLGLGAVKPFDPALRGAGDISYVANIVPANLAGLGPMGWGTHSVGEYIELYSLPIQTQRAAIFIYRLTKDSN